MSLHFARFAPSVVLRAALLAAVLLLAAPAAHAQMGTVRGRVLDKTGSPVSGAAVELRRDASSFRRGTVSDAQGAYEITGLPAGNYRALVTRGGYRATRGSVLLATGENLLYDWVLDDSPLLMDTVVAIGGSDVVIRRSDTEFNTRLSETALELLPTTHDAAELVAHTPGARVGQVWGGATQQANSYQIDGLAANHPGVGGDLVKPSINWIESVEIRGLGAAAEYGNFQGGLINVNTKSGTNDFEGVLHASTETAGLTGSNLQRYDVATEVRSRFDVEAELRGPLVRNRLFYYLAGQWINRDEQVVNHLWGREGRNSFYHPETVGWTEQKTFGKLLWQPTARDQLSISGGYLNAQADRFGLTGFETDAGLRMTSPTSFYQAEFTHVFGPGTQLELGVGGFDRDERREAEDPSLPSIMATRLTPGPTYQNPLFSYRMAPSSNTVRGSLSLEARTFGLTHSLKLGGEYSAGGWMSSRTRNGGMTWRPQALRVDTLFNGMDPATWYRFSGFVSSEWGGEIDLNADVRNGAVYLQDNIEIGSRLTISPGVRFGWWEGYITPGGGVGERFRAVRDARPEARLGLIYDVTGRNDLVVKAHAGRYHQSMFAQIYDRVQGGNVFTNQQKWFYYGRVQDPGATFTPAERDALAGSDWRFQEQITLNQTGPVENYRQPYVDQLVVGVEKQLGRWVKAEAVYVNRTNGNMVALVDRNAESNYYRFSRVNVYDDIGEPLRIEGSPVYLENVYVPNYLIVELLKARARAEITGPLGPGLTFADTLRTWNPDYVLTTVPQARRNFQQLQFVLRVGRPKWGGTLSIVGTDLKGDLDNVSGYGEGNDFGAGPFTNPNQAVNFFGPLPNYSPWELKFTAYGELGWGLRGGVFWNEALGDRYSAQHNLSGMLNTYRIGRDTLNPAYFFAMAGQPMFIGNRGQFQYRNRSTVDLHLERGLALGGAQWLFSLDAFNIFARDTPLKQVTSINKPQNYNLHLYPNLDPAQFYGTVLERQRPRAIRIGTVIRF